MLHVISSLSVADSVTLSVSESKLVYSSLIFVDTKCSIVAVATNETMRAVTSSASSVSVAGVDLPVADDIKVLGVVLDRRLSFHKHVSAVARSCNYHAQAIRHIRLFAWLRYRQ